jgi:hypothetical protein
VAIEQGFTADQIATVKTWCPVSGEIARWGILSWASSFE